MIKKLVKCKACKKDVSSKADKCPQCGHPIKKNALILPLQIILGIMVVLVLIGIFNNPEKKEDSNNIESLEIQAEQVDEAKKEQRLLDECESLVLPQVTDASTYSRSRTSSYVVKMGDGNYSIKLNFTAKDGLGEKIKFQGVCLYETEDKNLKLLRVVERNR